LVALISTYHYTATLAALGVDDTDGSDNDGSDAVVEDEEATSLLLFVSVLLSSSFLASSTRARRTRSSIRCSSLSSSNASIANYTIHISDTQHTTRVMTGQQEFPDVYEPRFDDAHMHPQHTDIY
jgi:hypothetical protein